MWHVLLDCYPAVGSDSFEEYAFAAIGCFVADSHAPDPDFARRVASTAVTEKGWSVVESIEITRIEDDSEDDAIRRRLLSAARRDGLAFDFHRVPRQRVPGHQAARGLTLAFTSAITALATGAFTYVGSKGEQAWGYIGDEPFFPLWTDVKAAARSADEWPSCQIAMIEIDQLADYLRERYVDEERMLALGFIDNTMTTFHPLALRDAANARFSLTAS